MNPSGEKTVIGCTYSQQDGMSCDYKDVKSKKDDGIKGFERDDMDNLILVLENDARLNTILAKSSPDFDVIKKRVKELGEGQAKFMHDEYMFNVKNNVRFFIPPRRAT